MFPTREKKTVRVALLLLVEEAGGSTTRSGGGDRRGLRVAACGTGILVPRVCCAYT